MPRNLSHEVYQDKIIKCFRCRKIIGTTAFDSQVLVIGDMAFLNYACWTHICGKSQSWLAPVLPGEKAEDAPDISNIIHKALSVKEKAKKMGYRPKYTGNYPNQTEQPQATDF